MEQTPQENKKVRYGRVIGLSVLFYILAWTGAGIFAGIQGLTKEEFGSISPPQEFTSGLIGIWSRLVALSVSVPQWLLNVCISFIPLIGMLVCILYFVVKRKQSSTRRTIIWSFTSVLVAVGMVIPLMLVVPGQVAWLMFRVEASRDVSRATAALSHISVIIDANTVLQKALEVRNVQLFPDGTTASSALLAAYYASREGKKLTYYESFYLPVFFSTHAFKSGNDKIDTASAVLVGDNRLVLNAKTDKETAKNFLLKLSEHIIKNKYGDRINESKLKKFDLVNDVEFNKYYQLKATEDLQKDISQNEASIRTNQAVIDGYPASVKELDAKYAQFVTTYESDYQKNCVERVVYNNCAETRKTIDGNKVTIEQDKKNALETRDLAIQYNKPLRDAVAGQKKQLADYGSSNEGNYVNSQKESSAAATFTDTIYLRFFKEAPLNSERFHVAVHELLHVYSHQSNDSLPTAFDEGMTEMLALKALGYDELNSIRMAGYPLEMQVVMALGEKIPFDSLLDVYFTKSGETLKGLVKKYFPNTDYDVFMTKFGALLEGTYHVHGAVHSFDKGFIDHADVVALRQMLGLSDKKFGGTTY